MGKEARAAARWGDAAGMVTALLEGDALVVRGEIRATVARSAIRDVVVEAGELRFFAGDVPVVLTLGTTAANRWATAIAAGPPALETKLGIDGETVARVYGEVDDAALEAALASASARVAGRSRAAAPVTLVFVRANGARELESALAAHLDSDEAALPLWVVYRKGKNVPLNEAGVRAAVRARGLGDTKVAGISPALSAMRFSKPAPALAASSPPARPGRPGHPSPAAVPSVPPQRGAKPSVPPQRAAKPSVPPDRTTKASVSPDRTTKASVPPHRATKAAKSVVRSQPATPAMPASKRAAKAVDATVKADARAGTTGAPSPARSDKTTPTPKPRRRS